MSLRREFRHSSYGETVCQPGRPPPQLPPPVLLRCCWCCGIANFVIKVNWKIHHGAIVDNVVIYV